MSDLQNDLQRLRNDPDFLILLNNLWVAAKSNARSPFVETKGFKNFSELAELDLLTYFRQKKFEPIK